MQMPLFPQNTTRLAAQPAHTLCSPPHEQLHGGPQSLSLSLSPRALSFPANKLFQSDDCSAFAAAALFRRGPVMIRLGSTSPACARSARGVGQRTQRAGAPRVRSSRVLTGLNPNPAVVELQLRPFRLAIAVAIILRFLSAATIACLLLPSTNRGSETQTQTQTQKTDTDDIDEQREGREGGAWNAAPGHGSTSAFRFFSTCGLGGASCVLFFAFRFSKFLTCSWDTASAFTHSSPDLSMPTYRTLYITAPSSSVRELSTPLIAFSASAIAPAPAIYPTDGRRKATPVSAQIRPGPR